MIPLSSTIEREQLKSERIQKLYSYLYRINDTPHKFNPIQIAIDIDNLLDNDISEFEIVTILDNLTVSHLSQFYLWCKIYDFTDISEVINSSFLADRLDFNFFLELLR